tara:strand:- start:3209 stop:3358 length:150 start_codon:yes stop_codon:yes gene_type:complete
VIGAVRELVIAFNAAMGPGAARREALVVLPSLAALFAILLLVAIAGGEG